MGDHSNFSQPMQEIQGQQINIGRDAHFHQHTPRRVPLQKPFRTQHFTGREKELEYILKDLRPGQIVTLCGPGGIGKSAIAIEAIWRLAPDNEPPEIFPDGIIFHTFYHQPQAAIALEAIARSYGDVPRPSPSEAARRALANRRALLVLDGAEVADNLKAILDVAGCCGILITTRRHSDAPNDWMDILPLAIDQAIRLLKKWGQNYINDEIIAYQICELLGGLPLAIFLAGRYMAHHKQYASDYLTWLKAKRLDSLDMGEQQHLSVSFLMKYSLSQLDELAQITLGVAGLLSPDPFGSELITEALDIPSIEADRCLGELANYGLLIRPNIYYQITHALIHTYAREQLPPKRDVLVRLAKYYCKFIKEKSKQDLIGYKQLDAHRSHILAVQSACIKASEWILTRDIAWRIKDYLNLRGHRTERIAAAEAGLLAARTYGIRQDEGDFLILLGRNYSAIGRYNQAMNFYEQRLAIANDINDRWGEVEAFNGLGRVHRDLGETDRAIQLHEQALMIAREIGYRLGEARVLNSLGKTYRFLGEYRHAIEFIEQSLYIIKEIGNKRDEIGALINLGRNYTCLGEYSLAIRFIERSLEMSQKIGDLVGEGESFCNMSLIQDKLGNRSQAIDLAQNALSIFEYIESPYCSNIMRRKLSEWREENK